MRSVDAFVCCVCTADGLWEMVFLYACINTRALGTQLNVCMSPLLGDGRVPCFHSITRGCWKKQKKTECS